MIRARLGRRPADLRVWWSERLDTHKRGRRVGPVAYVRTVKTASEATAVQIVHSSRRGARDIEHLGSAHDAAELQALEAAARQRLAQGQGTLDLGLNSVGGSGPLKR